MSAKVSSQEMVDRAMCRVKTLPSGEAIRLHSSGEALFVDLREPHEMALGAVPSAISVPRGTLEFRVDPESPFFLEEFASNKPLVLYCQLAARSALAAATLMDMGIENVAHIGGGFAAWRDDGGPINAA